MKRLRSLAARAFLAALLLLSFSASVARADDELQPVDPGAAQSQPVDPGAALTQPVDPGAAQ